MKNLQRPTTAMGLAVAALAFWLAACDDGPGSQTSLPLADDPRRGFIAFVGAGPNDPVWPVLRAGAAASAQVDVGPVTRFLNPSNDTPRAQAELLKSLTDPDLRGLCIHVNDINAVTTVLQQLHHRGIPIVSMLVPAPLKNRFAHVGIDERAVGRELARCVEEGLGPEGGTIMVLHAGYEHPVYGVRYLSFSERIGLVGNITVLGEFNCRADPQEARRIIRERSARYPRLTAWVALSDWPLQGNFPAGDLFRSHMRYITIGGWPRHWVLIQDGRIPYMIGAEYGEIGGRALRFCRSAVRDPAQPQQTAEVALRQLSRATLNEYQEDWSRWVQEPITRSAATQQAGSR